MFSAILPIWAWCSARLRNRRKRQQLPELLAEAFPGDSFRGAFHNIEHHLAHLSSAFHVSPFEEAVVVSVDGFGDFASAAWGVGRGKDIDIEGRVHFPHSLGIFYQALTHYLGFPYYGDEYKVMGLAPYGKPTHLDAMRRIVRLMPDGTFKLDLAYFRHHTEEMPYQWENGAPQVGDLFSPGARGTAGPAAPARRSARGSAPRHRPLGAGDVRRGVLSSDRPAATALWLDAISHSRAAAR